MRRTGLLCAAALACTPLPPGPAPPASTPAPPDSPAAPGPKAPVPPASPSLPAIQLTADAGLRILLDIRAYDVLATPGSIITVEPDLLHVASRDAVTGAPRWTTKVQPDANGWHTLFGLGEAVVLLAGPRRIHLDAATGIIKGSRTGFFHGADKGCRLDMTAGDRTADWSAWIPASPHTATCAQQCGCSLSVFDCAGATGAGAAFHSATTHLYHSLGEPHDTVCFDEPGVLTRGRESIVVRVQDDKAKPVIAGLDPTTFARTWTRPDLAEQLSRYAGAGADPGGRTCWIADDHNLVAFTCATGATRWRMRLAEAKADDPGRTTVTTTAAGLLVQHRDEQRTLVELRAVGGKRMWRRELPAAQHAVVPDTRLDYLHGGAKIEAHAILDPATGATLATIRVADKQTLMRTPTGYARLATDSYAEFDGRGTLLREAPLASASVIRVTPTHLVERTGQHVRILLRGTLQPALTLPGTWSVRDTAALGPDAIVAAEHRGNEPLRVLVLRP